MHLTSIYQLQIKKTLQVKLQVRRTLITLKPRFEFFDLQRPALLYCFVVNRSDTKLDPIISRNNETRY